MNNIQSLISNIQKVIVGKKDVIELVVTALLCKGHTLIEDVPGTGKTMLARALARSISVNSKRLQCTPDLLPSDITGVPIFNQKNTEFEFHPGPIFTNILLADEINRATPRAQSALLECMAEYNVSIDRKTYRLPEIFMVIATQNSVDMIGTHVLPEAQLDRFLIRVHLGYPSITEELHILQEQANRHPIDKLESVTTAADIVKHRSAVKNVHLNPDVTKYIVQIVAATRQHPAIHLGASPRGTLALARGAQGLAYIREQTYVTPDLVKILVEPTLAHRLILNPQAVAKNITAQMILEDIISKQTVPV